MNRKKSLWIILPLAVLLLAGSLILALPSLVSSPQHRATIEALASSLTGRSVHIGGELSLALKPTPQLIAGDVTITGPDAETVTAKSLTLDISLSALLHGQLIARSLMLQSPNISYPWPLPNGTAAIAPPPWLAALHAQINNGRISFGNLVFAQVSADIFTGTDGALSVSGTGLLAGHSIDLTASLGGLGIDGTAPLTIDTKDSSIILHFSGSASTENALNGALTFNATGKKWLSNDPSQTITGTGTIKADPGNILLSNLQATQGPAQLSGDADMDLTKTLLTLHLNGNNLSIHPAILQADLPSASMPGVHAVLTLDHSTLAGFALAHLQAAGDVSNAGLNISNFSATLPGNAILNLSGQIDPSGNLQGHVHLTSDEATTVFGAVSNLSNLPAVGPADLAASLNGTLRNLSISGINGTFGPASVTGTALVQTNNGQTAINGAWHFSQLDLTAYTAALSQFKPNNNITANIEITADHASFSKIPMASLLIDAGIADKVIVRRLSASLYNGMVAASFTVAAGGEISSARALISMPSALPLAALLPPQLQPLTAILNAPLATSLIASGPANGLATSGTLTLGDYSLTASPILDLIHLSAAGPLTLHHPNAIAAFKQFGFNTGLPWPGAGSIALRANMSLSPAQMGLPDFVLSMGDLTASGRFAITPDYKITGQIDADTLALPPVPADLSPLWAGIAVASGKLDVSANNVLVAGRQVFGTSTGTLVMQPNDAVLTIGKASLGSGSLTGSLSATTAPATPPSLAASLTFKAVDLSTIQLPVNFPLTLPTGLADAQFNITASGFSTAAWLATASGSASLQAKAGSITRFNLPGIVQALTGQTNSLRNACVTGTSPFDNLAITANADHGIIQISLATLQSASGTASASGTIDLPDQDVALTFGIIPKIQSPPGIGLTIVGGWANPHQIPNLKAAQQWKPTP